MWIWHNGRTVILCSTQHRYSKLLLIPTRQADRYKMGLDSHRCFRVDLSEDQRPNAATVTVAVYGRGVFFCCTVLPAVCAAEDIDGHAVDHK